MRTVFGAKCHLFTNRFNKNRFLQTDQAFVKIRTQVKKIKSAIAVLLRIQNETSKKHKNLKKPIGHSRTLCVPFNIRFHLLHISHCVSHWHIIARMIGTLLPYSKWHYPVVWIAIQINIDHFILSIRHCHKQHILGTTFCVGTIL